MRSFRRLALPAALLPYLVLNGCGGSSAPEQGPALADAPAPRVIQEPPPITAGRAAEGTGPYAPGVDVLHYEVELALAPEGSQIWGRTQIEASVDSTAGGAITLDFTGLAVREVRVDGRAVTWEHSRGRLRVPAEAGRHRVEIRYSGTPDDGLILRNNVHGDPAVFADNWPNRARFWFPSVDHPSDKATVRFIVHAPSAWEVIANGIRETQPTSSPAGSLTDLGFEGTIDHRTWRYATDVEIPAYTMVVGATDFAIHTVGQGACGNAPEAPSGCVSVTSWSYPADSATAARIFARAHLMVDYFAETVGPFPYEKLANVQSATRFGGMENASAIFYSEEAIAEGRDMEGTVSHEIAHQWFGDSVTEVDWSHLWLSEGFATYFGALFFEVADGVEPFRATLERNRQRIVASQVVATRPVIDEQERDLFQLLNDNNYPKGGWVLHMLRGLVGDDDFFRGVRAYYRTHRDKTATTDDFRVAMETASGQELDWFFEQWLRHPGFPVFRVTWNQDQGTETLNVTVEQVQDAAWPTYTTPVTLEAVVGGESVQHTIEMTERTATAVFAVPGAVTDLVLDPEGWILKDLR